MQRINRKIEWSTDQITLLTELHPQFTSKKWKRISQIFVERGFKRSEMQCRQKWINFLDPAINRHEWEQSQLQKLYQVYEQVGTRWCVVQKFIGRTQNKIKNRFYGTLRNYIRFVVNHFNHRDICYNYEISKLSPRFLNQLYQAEGQFKFIGQEIKSTIYAMRFRIVKGFLADRIKEARPLYERINSVVFKVFQEIKPISVGTLNRVHPPVIKNQASSIISQSLQQIVQVIAQPQPVSIEPVQQPYYPFMPQLSYQQNFFYWYI